MNALSPQTADGMRWPPGQPSSVMYRTSSPASATKRRGKCSRYYDTGASCCVIRLRCAYSLAGHTAGLDPGLDLSGG